MKTKNKILSLLTAAALMSGLSAVQALAYAEPDYPTTPDGRYIKYDNLDDPKQIPLVYTQEPEYVVVIPETVELTVGKPTTAKISILGGSGEEGSVPVLSYTEKVYVSLISNGNGQDDEDPEKFILKTEDGTLTANYKMYVSVVDEEDDYSFYVNLEDDRDTVAYFSADNVEKYKAELETYMEGDATALDQEIIFTVVDDEVAEGEYTDTLRFEIGTVGYKVSGEITR